MDEKFGDGFSQKIQKSLLELNPEENQEILSLFSTNRFIVTENSNYQTIESIARDLGIIK